MMDSNGVVYIRLIYFYILRLCFMFEKKIEVDGMCKA